ncbi:MAG: ferritin-like domain-containing protein [Solirubrobacteraceae bacterium]|nr:ferritin-like domain-containing protein [Patulibacter sp.]
MSDYLNLETLDPSGDIRNAADDAGAFDSTGLDRRAMLRRGAAAGGGLIVAGGLFQTMLSPAEAAISKSKKSKKNDGAILNYALTLEFLEAAFYTQAVAGIQFADPNVGYFATTVKSHEVAHVAALQATLKKLKIKAITAPTVQFGDTVTDVNKFLATSKVLEDTGVSAYAGQVTNVFQAPVLAAAASIHSVEARHAAWVRYLLGGGAASSGAANAPAPNIVDPALTEKKVLSAVKATGFVPGL